MTKTFKEAFERLKEIEKSLDNSEILDIDDMQNMQKEADELYEFCEKKLKNI